ncbi:Hypothetical Protein FCC1311_097442 [Hondaea fermentalgiana]|uniref:Uncharacterized protein n=1 Tax=Hondaea fermentalgiana TaxID=2315210 RepID=A0A2R5GYI1_9STRA|nr:Hypothetical Protein FCC1311_097442 [Hondaea fermentalgiana]|eukprot:GBG33521.1 Hypothetical Protein FCC1311_097442 [Hondaea fermentalgiana]
MLFEAYRERVSTAGRALVRPAGPNAILIMQQSIVIVYQLTGRPNAAVDATWDDGLVRLPGFFVETQPTLIVNVPKLSWHFPVSGDMALDFQNLRAHDDWLKRPPGKSKPESVTTYFYDCTSSADGNYVATVSSAGDVALHRVPAFGHDPKMQRIPCEMNVYLNESDRDKGEPATPISKLYVASLAWHPRRPVLACGSRINAGHISLWGLHLDESPARAECLSHFSSHELKYPPSANDKQKQDAQNNGDKKKGVDKTGNEDENGKKPTRDDKNDKKQTSNDRNSNASGKAETSIKTKKKAVKPKAKPKPKAAKNTSAREEGDDDKVMVDAEQTQVPSASAAGEATTAVEAAPEKIEITESREAARSRMQWITAMVWCPSPAKVDSLVVGYSDGSIALLGIHFEANKHSIEKVELLRMLRGTSGHMAVSSLRFREPGRLVASLGNLVIWWKNIHSSDDATRDQHVMMTTSHAVVGCELHPTREIVVSVGQTGQLLAWRPNTDWSATEVCNERILQENTKRVGGSGMANAATGLAFSPHGAALLTLHLQKASLMAKSNRRVPGPHTILSAHPLVASLKSMIDQCVAEGRPYALHDIAWWASRTSACQFAVATQWRALAQAKHEGEQGGDSVSFTSEELIILSAVIQLVGISFFRPEFDPTEQIRLQRIQVMSAWIVKVAQEVNARSKGAKSGLPASACARALALLDLAREMAADGISFTQDQVQAFNKAYEALGAPTERFEKRPLQNVERAPEVPSVQFSRSTLGLQGDLLARDMYTLEELDQYEVLECDICGSATQAYIREDEDASNDPAPSSFFTPLLPQQPTCLFCGVALFPNSHLINGL